MYESLPGGKGLVKSTVLGGRVQGDIVETGNACAKAKIISPQ